MAAGEQFAEAGGDEGIGGGDIAIVEADHAADGWGRQWCETVPLALARLVGYGVTETDQDGMGVGGYRFPEPFEGCDRGRRRSRGNQEGGGQEKGGEKGDEQEARGLPVAGPRCWGWRGGFPAELRQIGARGKYQGEWGGG